MSIELKIPSVGESIQEVQIGQWLKHEGDRVAHDETIVELETDKASMELPAPIDGVISKIVKHDGDSVAVGQVIAYLEPDGQAKGEGKAVTGEVKEKTPAPAGKSPVAAPAEVPGPVKPPYEDSPEPVAEAAPQQTAPEQPEDGPAASPSVRRLLREHHLKASDVEPTGEGGRLLRDDVLRYAEEHEQQPAADQSGKTVVPEVSPKQEQETPKLEAPPRTTAIEPMAVPAPASLTPAMKASPEDSERVVPMSLIRRRIAERLVEAQQKAALLTTFNEIDMSAVADLRTSLREPFQQKFGVKLGILSFFVKAAIEALQEVPAVNAEVRGTDIIYRNAYHIGIAIGAKRGLVVPVLRHADRLSFAQIEQAIDDYVQRAGSNKLEPADLTGGTFTISNGGIYGSLLSTPIVNPPQSGVLGLHAIQQRPVARDGQVVIRPMMYVALTYDHRLIDGREAVTFLKRIKETVESPARLLIGV
jgi:2-oxoglutarate dehydrogenase E2 component (dihydrolipoamide succinyltransferase)